MDSKVIQEIADQLGMAVDQVGQFITEYAPEYAAMKVTQITVGLSIAWIVALILTATALAFIWITVRRRNSDYELAKEATLYPRRNDYSDYATFFVFVLVGVVAVFAIGVAVYLTAVNLANGIGWSQYPEAMLIDMALKAVG